MEQHGESKEQIWSAMRTNLFFFSFCLGMFVAYEFFQVMYRFDLMLFPGFKHDFMLLKNLMEEKQLNFNRPLLSLRRFPSTVSTETDEKKRTGKYSLPNVRRLPCYRPELKSGPVRIPGTVPFVWEQYPGRPKAKAESHAQTRSPIIIPKPPPGRVLKAKPSVPGNVYEKQVVSSVGENAVEEKECSDSGDGGKAHVDARSTLQVWFLLSIPQLELSNFH